MISVKTFSVHDKSLSLSLSNRTQEIATFLITSITDSTDET